MGLINDYSKRKKADIAMLYDFMLLLEKGAFYLAGERMKAPQFFNSIRGKSEVFNEGCRRMGEVLSNRSCKSGEEGWKAVWEKKSCGILYRIQNFDKMINGKRSGSTQETHTNSPSFAYFNTREYCKSIRIKDKQQSTCAKRKISFFKSDLPAVHLIKYMRNI